MVFVTKSSEQQEAVGFERYTACRNLVLHSGISSISRSFSEYFANWVVDHISLEFGVIRCSPVSSEKSAKAFLLFQPLCLWIRRISMPSKPFTREDFDRLPIGHPLFFRGPQRNLSVLHTKMGPDQISRCAQVSGEELPKWKFPAKVQPGEKYPHWSSGTEYTATSDVGEGASRMVTLFFIGTVNPERLPMFSLDPLPVGA